MYASVAGAPAGAALGPRTRSDFEFVWMLAGKARWRWLDADVDLVLEPGSLLLVRPGMRNEFRWDRKRPSRHGFAHFRLADEGADHGDWPLVRPIVSPGPLGALLDYVLWVAQEPSDAWRRVVEETVGAILRIFLLGPPSGPATDQPVEPAPLAVVLDHVRRQWRISGMRPVPVSELAAVAAVSREHLSRLFRRQYGYGIATGLELVRLTRAAAMLARSDATVTEAAHWSGFADPSHFSHRFRASYGLSPRSYRLRSADRERLITPDLLRLSHRLTWDRHGDDNAGGPR